jgi:hypothetical protein
VRRLAKLGFGVGVLLEPAGEVGLEVRLVTFGVQRRPAALGRSEGDLGAGVLEDIIRRREFLQPEAGLASRVAELVVRSENQQDFHKALLSLVVGVRDRAGRPKATHVFRRPPRPLDPILIFSLCLIFWAAAEARASSGGGAPDSSASGRYPPPYDPDNILAKTETCVIFMLTGPKARAA